MRISFNLEEERKKEIRVIILFVFGLIVLLSLISSCLNQGRNWLGILGEKIADLLKILMGTPVAFAVPFIIFLWAIGQMKKKEKEPAQFFRRAVGGVLLIVSLSTCLSLPYSSPEKKFFFGGLIGSYMTASAEYAFNITRIFGVVGAYIVTISILLVSILLSTEFLFSDYIKKIHKQLTDAYKLRKYTRRRKILLQQRQTVFKAKIDPPTLSPIKVTVKEKKEPSPKQIELPLEDSSDVSEAVREKKGNYQLPPLDLLNLPTEHLDNGKKDSDEDLVTMSRKLEETLAQFNIQVQVVEVIKGPVVTLFVVEPAPGVKISSINSLADDIALAMRAQKEVRIIAPLPGKGAIGIEVPNYRPATVYLREIIASEAYAASRTLLPLALGKTIDGDPYVADLRQMPHLLIAGTTGSGKSVCINAIVTSILYRAYPDEVKFIMVDPKRVELNIFSGIPHLLTPVVTEPKKASYVLKWAVQEMDRRYSLFADLGCRDIDSYTKIQEKPEKLPFIVIIIDELADLMLVARVDNEDMITRLAQMGRAVGIHLILATQRPSVDVITGLIKANFPSRIAFQVSSKIDSRVILDMSGAETLLGKGDMLFSPGGISKPIRIQGSYISEEELEKVTDFVRSFGSPQYLFTNAAEIVQSQKEEDEENKNNKKIDELYYEAVRIVKKTRQASASMLQTQLGIGYPRARKLIERMEQEGIVGPMRGSKPREILIPPDEE